MSELQDNIAFDHQYCREDQSVASDVFECQKHLGLLQRFRQILSDFAINCVCDQNKDIKCVLNCLEIEYKLIFNNNISNESKDQLKNLINERNDFFTDEEDIDICNKFKDQDLNEVNSMRIIERPVLCQKYSNVDITEDNGHKLAFIVPIRTYSSTKTMNLINEESITTSSPIRRPHSPPRSSVKELSIDSTDNKLTKRSKDLNFGDNCHKMHKKLKFDKKFNDLIIELKNGNLQQFIDPNNKLISVYRKKHNSNDSESEGTVVFKCNYNYCKFETTQRRYIVRHVDRHKILSTKGSSMKYRIFCQLLEDLKSGRIDSFEDPEYPLVSVLLKERPQISGEEKERTVFYKCNHFNCKYESNGKYYIRNHVIRHQKNRTFVCNICEEELKSKLSFVEHRIEAHCIDQDRLFKCDLPNCSFKTIVKQTFKMHSLSHQTDKPFKCGFNGCDMYFKSKLAVSVHQKAVHTSDWLSCEWPGCDMRSKSRTYMRTHLAAHTGEKITVGKIRSILKNGNYVSTVDKNNDMFSVIRRQILNQSDGKIKIGPQIGYKCNYTDCEFICLTPTIIRQHITVHSVGKTFECDLCQKRFVLQNHMKNHKKLVHHINNKSPVLSCQYCDYKTRNSFCLRQHSVTHQTETPFKCNQNGCLKSFKTEVNLRSHINYTHNNVRPYGCEYPECESTFKMKSQLNRHLKTHTNNKELYRCDRCLNTFRFKSILAKHKKNKH